MADIYKAAGIIIKDQKLLVLRGKGKDIFMAPGGKLEADETPIDAVIRELNEELTITVKPNNLEPFGEFEAEAAGQPGKWLYMSVFLVKDFQGELRAASEIEELQWVGANNPTGLLIGSIFEHDVLPRLREKGLVS